MKNFGSGCRTVAAVALALALHACANDPLTDPIHPGAPVRNEPAGGSKTDAIVRVAHATASRGDEAMAASLYRRAHAMEPANYEAALGLGATLARLGAHEEAAGAYRDAIAIRADDPEALRGLGNMLILLNEPATAAQQFNRALGASKDPRVYNGLGVAHDMLDDHEAAQAAYRAGLALAPGNAELANNLGLSLLLSGSIQESVVMLRRAAGGSNATARHRLNLALALVIAGETAAAEQIARVDLDPATADAQIAYFETVAALRDSRALRKAIGAHLAGGGGGSGS